MTGLRKLDLSGTEVGTLAQRLVGLVGLAELNLNHTGLTLAWSMLGD
jgi:hypothetical protein